jgi:regulator of sirC expression with transglutaminase-like and TPR domain
VIRFPRAAAPGALAPSAALASAFTSAIFAFALTFALSACRLEPPDPASQAAAILRKHPSDFQDQLASLDALAAREVAELEPAAVPASRPILAESLYAYRLRLKPGLDAAASDRERLDRLHAFFFDSLGLAAVDSDTSLASSVPSLALAQRRGSCVALCLLYLALGRSLDLPLVPIFLPGHVALRFRPREGQPVNIETLRRGIARTDSFYRETFSLGKRPWYSLADGRPEQALAALLFNMANARRTRGDLASAAEEYSLVAEVLPAFPEALGNQGVCALGRDRQAAADLFRAAYAGDSLSPARANLAGLGVSVP